VRVGGVRYLDSIMKQVKKMDGKIISGVSYAGWGAPETILGDNDKPAMLDASVRSMKELVKRAEDLEITYCVEAVNRFEGALLNTSKEAVEYVKMVDSPAIGVLLDTFHMNIEETNIGDAIRHAGSYLKGFHTGENNRVVPGKGHLDWDEIFSALKDVNYKGRIVSEPFVLTGGEVGFSIKTWRNLVDDTSEEALDREAKFLLDFEKGMMEKWGL
ncbi:MAG: sugar phosphate isomerase/epimerase, partial [Clostridia bacterium]|nr:sugar phosphate isomerase/epimerase [Clostridia bacterium]